MANVKKFVEMEGDLSLLVMMGILKMVMDVHSPAKSKRVIVVQAVALSRQMFAKKLTPISETSLFLSKIHQGTKLAVFLPTSS